MSSRKKNRSAGAARRSASARRAGNRLCPCGSGRAYKNCCGEGKQENSGSKGRSGRRSYIALTLVVFLLAGGLIYAFLRPWESLGDDPEPWEYDEVRDRHWHYDHWDDGPPPVRSDDAPTASDTPRPWEYDEANDRHWDPLHGHWHSGRPPQNPWAIPLAPVTPDPWEYDESNDRYWHPGHEHWHPGSPPPQEEHGDS